MGLKQWFLNNTKWSFEMIRKSTISTVTCSEINKIHHFLNEVLWDFPGLNKKIPALFQGFPGLQKFSRVFQDRARTNPDEQRLAVSTLFIENVLAILAKVLTVCCGNDESDDCDETASHCVDVCSMSISEHREGSDRRDVTVRPLMLSARTLTTRSSL